MLILWQKRWRPLHLSHFLFVAFHPEIDPPHPPQPKKKKKSLCLFILEWNMATFLCNATPEKQELLFLFLSDVVVVGCCSVAHKVSGERDITVTARFEPSQVSRGCPEVENVISRHSFLVAPAGRLHCPLPAGSSRAAMTAPAQRLLPQQSVDQARDTKPSALHLLNKARVTACE